MTHIKHHLSDELLLDYAGGGLGEGWSLAVASHLALCPSCRSRLRGMERVGGMLLGAIDQTRDDMDGSWTAMKRRLCAEDTSTHKPDPEETETQISDGRKPVLPQPLRSYLGGDVDQLKWRPLGPSAYQVPVAISDGETRGRLLRIPAGKPVPEHTHGGRELTLVLAGSFIDDGGVFARGDIEEADETVMHQPVAGPGEDCICLAITDAPLQFKNWMVRLVQPILGI